MSKIRVSVTVHKRKLTFHCAQRPPLSFDHTPSGAISIAAPSLREPPRTPKYIPLATCSIWYACPPRADPDADCAWKRHSTPSSVAVQPTGIATPATSSGAFEAPEVLDADEPRFALAVPGYHKTHMRRSGECAASIVVTRPSETWPSGAALMTHSCVAAATAVASGGGVVGKCSVGRLVGEWVVRVMHGRRRARAEREGRGKGGGARR